MEAMNHLNSTPEKERLVDGHGYEIIGLKESKTDQEKITALENHLSMLQGLHNEIESRIEKRISNLKYPQL